LAHVLAFGDSNTYGTCPITDPVLRRRYAPHLRWPGVSLDILGAEWTLVEEGLPGRTTAHPDPEMGPHMDGRVGLAIALQSHGPIDIMTLMLGTNDLKFHFGQTAEQIASNASFLLDMAKSEEMQERHNGFRILLICPPPILECGEIAGKFAGGRAKSLLLADAFAAVAHAYDVTFLNAGDVIESSATDGVHLEQDMHQRLGETVAQRLRSMV